jgi:hypothetical protein
LLIVKSRKSLVSVQTVRKFWKSFVPHMKIRKGCDAVHVDGIAVAGSGAGESVERGYGERVEGGEGWPLSFP